MNEQSLVPTPNNPQHEALQAQYLNEAKDLIVAGEREQAYKLVVDVLRINQNNAEAVWMYANLVDNNEKASKALKRLLRLNPNNEKAKQMLHRIDSIEGEVVEVSPRIEVSRPLQYPKNPQENDQNLVMQQLLMQQQRLLEMQLNQQNKTPVININNTARATATNYGLPLEVRERNQLAYILGLLAGVFLGTFGVAHILNGKVGSGIIYMLLGWFIWLPIAAVVGSASAGLALCLIFPLHVLFAARNSQDGATSVRVRYQSEYAMFET